MTTKAKRQRAEKEHAGPKRVAFLRRISTDLENQPYSLDAQLHMMQRLASINDDWEVVADVQDMASGADWERNGLQEVLALAKAHKIDILLVCRIDRLSRSIAHLEEICGILQDHGVALRTVEGDVNTSSAQGKMFLQILGVFAEFERNLLIERIVAANYEKASKGYWIGSTSPFGYSREIGAKELTVAPAEAQIVREVFEMCVAGDGQRKIVKTLNNDGKRTRPGKLWVLSEVTRMLRNWVYAGFVEYDGVPFPGQHEPIVSVETFRRAMDLIDHRGPSSEVRDRTDSAYVLTGRMRCGRCDGAMVGTDSNGNGGNYRYYTCKRGLEGSCKLSSGADDGGPEAIRVRADLVEEHVKAALLDAYAGTDIFEEAIADAVGRSAEEANLIRDRIETAGKELRSLDLKIKRWVDAFEAGELDAHEFSDQFKARKAERAEVQVRLDKLQRELLEDEEVTVDTKVVAELRAVAERAFADGEPVYVKRLLAALVEKIEVFPDLAVVPTLRVPAGGLDDPAPLPG